MASKNTARRARTERPTRKRPAATPARRPPLRAADRLPDPPLSNSDVAEGIVKQVVSEVTNARIRQLVREEVAAIHIRRQTGDSDAATLDRPAAVRPAPVHAIETLRKDAEAGQAPRARAVAAEAPKTPALEEAVNGAEALEKRLHGVVAELVAYLESRLGALPPDTADTQPSRPGLAGKLHDSLASSHNLAGRLERELRRLANL